MGVPGSLPSWPGGALGKLAKAIAANRKAIDNSHSEDDVVQCRQGADGELILGGVEGSGLGGGGGKGLAGATATVAYSSTSFTITFVFSLEDGSSITLPVTVSGSQCT